ncbi:unnamed protein product, partial [Rotaria sp. Silwood1]
IMHFRQTPPGLPLIGECPVDQSLIGEIRKPIQRRRCKFISIFWLGE